MRQAVLTAVEQVEVREVVTPACGPGQVAVRVEACGICGSDLHMYRGHHPVFQPPVVMGHEFAGTIAAVGPGVPAARVGERVAVFPGVACGSCRNCRAGRYNVCPDWQIIGGHLPGGLADLVCVPAAGALPLPADLSPVAGAMVEVAAVGVHAVNRGRVEAGEPVAVLGAGPIGLMVAQVARSRGAAVVMSDPVPGRRALAEQLGFAAVPPADLGAWAAERTGRDGLSAAFDCVGAQPAIDQGLQVIGRGGRMVLVGILAQTCTFPGQLVQRGERDLIGVQAYVPADFHTAVQLIRSGAVQAESLVTHLFPLAQVGEAFRAAAGGLPDVVKVMVQI